MKARVEKVEKEGGMEVEVEERARGKTEKKEKREKDAGTVEDGDGWCSFLGSGLGSESLYRRRTSSSDELLYLCSSRLNLTIPSIQPTSNGNRHQENRSHALSLAEKTEAGENEESGKKYQGKDVGQEETVIRKAKPTTGDIDMISNSVD